jgi:hypothetical protein
VTVKATKAKLKPEPKAYTPVVDVYTVPDYAKDNPRIAILEILREDRLRQEERNAQRAVDECVATHSRMLHAKNRTLTGSLLEALGLGRPLIQGGRATNIEAPRPNKPPVRGKSKLKDAVQA